MSGPGLNQKDAHHAIHQAAFHEAEQLTLALRQALRAGDQQHALQVAAVLIEHWQTRTLRHADAEEAGWYRELLAERPELDDDIIALTRDHELLRILLGEIQGILSARGIAAGIVERFEAMLLLNGIHSRTEEHRLLGREDAANLGVSPANEAHQDASEDDAGYDAGHDAGVAPIPLAVARPALYERLSGFLRDCGLNPTDILAEVLTEADGRVILRVAYGAGYARAGEWPLPGDGTDAADATGSRDTPTAEDTLLREIAAACERATQADYHARMRTPN